MLRQLAVLALAGAVLSGCEKAIEVQAPPRSTTKAVIPRQYSTIDAPIVLPLADTQAALNRAAPKLLWTINQREEKCVPAQRVLKGKILGVKIFGAKGLKVTPDLGCQIVGRAVRGPIALIGRGDTLQMTMPVSAVVQVRNVGGIIKHETATGSVAVRANVRLGMRPLAVAHTIDDWRTQDVTALVSHLRAALTPGELLVVHDGGGDRRGTVAALRQLLPEWVAEGWSFTRPVGWDAATC